MFSLETMLDELQSVFNHIKQILDLIKITEISPRMNEIVSNSSRLMQTLAVDYSLRKDETEIPKLKRKYRVLIIYGVNGCSSNLESFIETFANSLFNPLDGRTNTRRKCFYECQCGT